MHQPDLFTPDDGYYRRLPAPSVEDSPTSVARAIREDDSGVTSRRQSDILDLLASIGARGATWKDVARELGLHHGQASGALSTLHKAGLVFALTKETRHGCQPYVHGQFRHLYTADERADSPATTKAGRRRSALEELHQAVSLWLAHPTDANLARVRLANKDVEG
jgi:predicted transcriptional regulator